MNIHAFIFSWKNHFDRACELEDQIGKLVRTTVINSENTPAAIRRGWQCMDESTFFAAKWNKLLDLFQGDLLFNVMADASIVDIKLLIEKAVAATTKYNLGIYEPNVDYTDVHYNTSRLQALAPGLMLVPRTDCTCWFVHGDILRRSLPANTSVTTYGWGIDIALAAKSYLLGRRVARDYSVLVKHPRSRGYSTDAAMEQMHRYFQTLEPSHERITLKLYRESMLLSQTDFRPDGMEQHLVSTK